MCAILSMTTVWEAKDQQVDEATIRCIPIQISDVFLNRHGMICNVLTPFISCVQSIMKVMSNFGCDGTTKVITNVIVAMVPSYTTIW